MQTHTKYIYAYIYIYICCTSNHFLKPKWQWFHWAGQIWKDGASSRNLTNMFRKHPIPTMFEHCLKQKSLTFWWTLWWDLALWSNKNNPFNQREPPKLAGTAEMAGTDTLIQFAVKLYVLTSIYLNVRPSRALKEGVNDGGFWCLERMIWCLCEGLSTYYASFQRGVWKPPYVADVLCWRPFIYCMPHRLKSHWTV